MNPQPGDPVSALLFAPNPRRLKKAGLPTGAYYYRPIGARQVRVLVELLDELRAVVPEGRVVNIATTHLQVRPADTFEGPPVLEQALPEPTPTGIRNLVADMTQRPATVVDAPLFSSAHWSGSSTSYELSCVFERDELRWTATAPRGQEVYLGRTGHEELLWVWLYEACGPQARRAFRVQARHAPGKALHLLDGHLQPRGTIQSVAGGPVRVRSYQSRVQLRTNHERVFDHIDLATHLEATDLVELLTHQNANLRARALRCQARLAS